MMTIRELIKDLQEFPPDTKVVVREGETIGLFEDCLGCFNESVKLAKKSPLNKNNDPIYVSKGSYNDFSTTGEEESVISIC